MNAYAELLDLLNKHQYGVSIKSDRQGARLEITKMVSARGHSLDTIVVTGKSHCEICNMLPSIIVESLPESDIAHELKTKWLFD